MKNICIAGSYVAVCLICLLAFSCGRSDKDFSLSDISGITSVELSHDSLVSTLTKTDSCWTINGSYKAGEEQLDMLLQIVNLQQVVSPVSQELQAKTDSLLTAEGIRIKVYEGTKAMLDFTVVALDSAGYIGRVDGNKQAYLLRLPNNDDNPFDYLSASPAYWRQNVIISALPSEIAMVTVEDMEKPEKSFRITREADGKLTLFDLYNEEVVKNVDQNKLNTYMSYWSGLSFEEMLDLKPEEHKAIQLSDSPYRLTVVTTDKERIGLQLYYIAGDELDAYGNALSYDPNRFYLTMNGGRDIALAKWVDFDLLLRDLSYFVEK